jgi:hypothetical protein
VAGKERRKETKRQRQKKEDAKKRENQVTYKEKTE